jgi:hypothetical protein
MRSLLRRWWVMYVTFAVVPADAQVVVTLTRPL